MAKQTVKMTIQLRRDTAANWEQFKDIIPAAGEPCFVIDKNILKIGDGVTTFEKLEPINGSKFEIAADGKSIVLEDNVLKLMGFDTAEVGAQPRKNADGFIEWIVPSTETVDGLKTTVAGLQSDVTNMQSIVTELREIVTPSAEGSSTLLERIESLEGKVGGEDVDAKIDAKINDFANKVSDDKIVNTLKELIDYVAEHGPETDAIIKDVADLRTLVGEDSVADQISKAVADSGHMDREEAIVTLLSKVEAKATYEKVKYEITNTPAGTLVDYRDKEIRVMVPAGAEFNKQNVGAGGDANTYYVTFKTYAPDNAVGYIEHLGNQVDSEILRDLKVDTYGRKYQPTWLGIAKYNDASGWTYYGNSSTSKKYIGWDYQIDWYDANSVVIESDKIRINLSNESCHNNIEPFYIAGLGDIKEIAVNGTLLDIVDGRVDITIPEPSLIVKGSDEIEVADDGTLSIKSINFSKIVQDEDEEIVLSGGDAAGK